MMTTHRCAGGIRDANVHDPRVINEPLYTSLADKYCKHDKCAVPIYGLVNAA